MQNDVCMWQNIDWCFNHGFNNIWSNFQVFCKKPIVGSSSDILDVITFMNTHYIFNQNS